MKLPNLAQEGTLILAFFTLCCLGATHEKTLSENSDWRRPHDMLLVDEQARQIHRVNLRSREANWSQGFGGELIRDLQLIGDDRVLVSIRRGYAELDIKTGAVLKQISGLGMVETARRTVDGHTWLGLSGRAGEVRELDENDREVRSFKVKGGAFIKVMRHSGRDTLFVGNKTEILEVDYSGNVLMRWRTSESGQSDAYMATRLPDGRVLVAGGKDKSFTVYDGAGKVIQKIGGVGSDLYNVTGGSSWAGFQLLPNDDVVLSIWQGHQGDGQGVQVVQFDLEGEIQWLWKHDPRLIRSLHGVIVLDGLDTSKMHDSLNGYLAPVE